MFRQLFSTFLLSISMTGYPQGLQSELGLQWWGWLLVIVLLAFIFWLALREDSEEESTRGMSTEEAPAKAAVDPVTMDDLKNIEGIGPKIESVLKAAGVQSFVQLAQMEVDNISTILSEGGIRLAFPESWPEQARLAAEGDMEGLKILQDDLKGGRQA